MADRGDIDAVLSRVDIVSLIEQYVTLKRAGRSFKGLCPFHQEKTPSFTVSPDVGRWHCFGQCGEGGDAIKFVQKIENLSFPEALERLAIRAGVTLSSQFKRGASGSSEGSAAATEAGERDRLYRINALALNYYRETLRRSSEAQEYVRGRDLAHATQEAFALGFAPDSWDGLATFLTRKGVSLADAERAGLVSKSDRGSYYDKLRGRLIFPIFDVQERPVAFGGRLLGASEPGKPKYWNSPETPIFSKSKTLYGLWRARKAINARGQAVVVEGYTDVIAAHQAGFEYVVATLGTSLTEEHVRILGRLASTVLLAFDADSAGLRAAFRAAEMFEAQEVEVHVLDLPEGDDPDSLLRAGKRAVFERALENALPLVEYRLQRLVRKGPTETERDRVALFRKALPILASVPSAIEREQYVKMLAPYHPHYRAGTVYAEDHIRQDVVSYQQGHRPEAPQGEAFVRPLPAVGRMPGGATEKGERHLLRALLGDEPVLAGLICEQIAPDDLPSETGRRLAAALFRCLALSPALDLHEALAALDSEEDRDALTALIMAQDEEPLTLSLIQGDIGQLKRRAKERQQAYFKEKIAAGQADSDDYQQYVRLSTELKGTPASQAA